MAFPDAPQHLTLPRAELSPCPTTGHLTRLRDLRLRARRAWLAILVQLDAFGLRPITYLTAVFWRTRGFKVRSRNRIAPLAGRSSHAYALWVARQLPPLPYPGPTAHPTVARIRTVIDCRHGTEGLEATLISLKAAGSDGEAILLGGHLGANNRADRPSDLALYGSGTGIWLCPMNPGDRIAPNAIAAYSSAIAERHNARIFYADDDLIRDGRRSEPHFKPQWNPDLFRHHDFITGSSIIFAGPDALAELPDERWMEKLVNEVILAGDMPVHLPSVLHHRLSRPSPVVPAKPAVDLAWSPPLVSVIVPTRNEAGLLRSCIAGLEQVAYPQIEIIVVDNGSDDRRTLDYLGDLQDQGHTVLRRPGPFNFSALNNEAVRHSRGTMLCFLNNDVETLDRDWLTIMVGQAARCEVGAVGARLLYPDKTIQHAGVFLGIGGGAGHGHRFMPADDPGYFERARLPQQVSAVTAACLVVARSKFSAVGGFDEVEFPVAFNDVDLCLKLNCRGWQSLYEPRATLLHHESKSRGSDSARPNRARFAAELAALKGKWQTDVRCDPYHHPNLSPFSEQFVIAV